MACNYYILKICPILPCPLLRAVTILCRPIGRRPTDNGNKQKLITVFKFSHDLSLFTCNYANNVDGRICRFYVAGLLLFIFSIQIVGK